MRSILAERKGRSSSLYPEDQQQEAVAHSDARIRADCEAAEENAYREVIWRQRVNEAARAVMLAYATGADLDQIGGKLQR